MFHCEFHKTEWLQYIVHCERWLIYFNFFKAFFSIPNLNWIWFIYLLFYLPQTLIIIVFCSDNCINTKIFAMVNPDGITGKCIINYNINEAFMTLHDAWHQSFRYIQLLLIIWSRILSSLVHLKANNQFGSNSYRWHYSSTMETMSLFTFDILQTFRAPFLIATKELCFINSDNSLSVNCFVFKYLILNCLFTMCWFICFNPFTSITFSVSLIASTCGSFVPRGNTLPNSLFFIIKFSSLKLFILSKKPKSTGNITWPVL